MGTLRRDETRSSARASVPSPPSRTALRVIIVNKFAHLTGGADQHCLGLAAALRQRGHDVVFLSTRDERNLEHEGRFVECSVTHSSRDQVGVQAQAEVFAKAMWHRQAASATQRLIDDFKPDVVHAHKLYPQLSVAPVVVAARAGIPVVQTLHDFEMVSASAIDARGGVWDGDETRLRFKLLNAATRPVRRRVHVPRVKAFVAVSRFVARVHAAHGIEASVFPNFVHARESSAADVPGFEERSGIVFLGRLRPEKGVLDVLGMAKRLPDVAVTVVGSGDLEPMLRGEAERLPNLKLAGFVPDPDVRDTLRRARVVVIPSRCQDAGPLVPLEAMAHATPVVAYSMGGLGEYVADSGGGRVVPVDVEALATTSFEVHEDRRTWERLSVAGFEAVTQRHSPEVYAERLEDLYSGLQ